MSWEGAVRSGASREFAEYSTRYQHVQMHREDGILELRLHSDGGPLVWGRGPLGELGYCFQDVGSDPANRVIVLTGTGDSFIKQMDRSLAGSMTAERWSWMYASARRLLMSIVDLPVPVVAAVNGPASIHAEIGVLSDIVIMARSAYFQDAPHFRYGTVPGDGVQVIWPMLLGPNRGRHFILTSKRLSAAEALQLGVVAEVVPDDQVLARAWDVARDLARQPDVTLRYARIVCTQDIRTRLQAELGHGLALEGLAAHGQWPSE